VPPASDTLSTCRKRPGPHDPLYLLVAELRLGVVPIHVFTNLPVQLVVVVGLKVLAALTVERPHTPRLLSLPSPTELS
jgi:hypothetical protein